MKGGIFCTSLDSSVVASLLNCWCWRAIVDCVVLLDIWSDLLLFCPKTFPPPPSQKQSLFCPPPPSLQSPITHICIFGFRIFLFRPLKKAGNLFRFRAPSALHFGERVWCHILTAFWQIDKDQIEVFSNIWCLEVVQAATVRAENGQLAETRRSYFQTGPDVMTDSNLNTGKSVQICRKLGSISCKAPKGAGGLEMKENNIWSWRSIDRNSLSNSCPEHFQPIAFLISQSRPQQPQQFFCNMKECPEPFRDRKSLKRPPLRIYTWNKKLEPTHIQW